MGRKGKHKLVSEDTSLNLNFEVDSNGNNANNREIEINMSDIDPNIVLECYDTLKTYTYDHSLLLFNSYNAKLNFINFINSIVDKN